MRSFGGVKLTARPVSKSQPEAGPPFFHELLPEEPFDQPVRITQADSTDKIRSPFAHKRDRPTPHFLDYAAYYVAGVLCEQNGHVHPLGEWPCKRSLAFAYTEVHLLAARKLPIPKQEKQDAKGIKVPQESGQGSGQGSGGQSGRESGKQQRRGRTSKHVRRKR